MEIRKITHSKCTPNKKQWFGIDATLNENDDVSSCFDKLKEHIDNQLKKVQ